MKRELERLREWVVGMEGNQVEFCKLTKELEDQINEVTHERDQLLQERDAMASEIQKLKEENNELKQKVQSALWRQFCGAQFYTPI